MDLIQALVISTIIHPTENSVVLEQSLVARLGVVICPIIVVDLTNGNAKLIL